MDRRQSTIRYIVMRAAHDAVLLWVVLVLFVFASAVSTLLSRNGWNVEKRMKESAGLQEKKKEQRKAQSIQLWSREFIMHGDFVED